MGALLKAPHGCSPLHPVLPLQAGPGPHLLRQVSQLEQLGPHPALQAQVRRGPRCFGDRWEDRWRRGRRNCAGGRRVGGVVPQARPLPSASRVPTPG